MREARLPRTGVTAETGRERAQWGLVAHRQRQAARVAPALPAMAEKRKAIALNRVNRWRYRSAFLMSRPDLVPGHIRAMARECGL